MKRKELVCDLRDYAKMTEEPPTGRAIEGQEEIMRRAADMIENSVEIDHVLEIIDEIEEKTKYSNWTAIQAIRAFRFRCKGLRGEQK